MPIQYNALSFNGKSTADFDFDIAVLNGEEIILGNSKSELQHITGRSGSVLKENENKEDIQKTYRLLLKCPTKQQLRDFKAWLSTDKGRLVTYHEQDVYYYVKKIETSFSEQDEFYSYGVTITFICDPIAYMVNVAPIIFTQNGTIDLLGTAICYPTIKIFGNSTTETRLTIGNNTVTLKSLSGALILDCIPDRSGLFYANGTPAIQEWKGDFFVFNPLEERRLGVVLGQGVSKIEIIGNWGYV